MWHRPAKPLVSAIDIISRRRRVVEKKDCDSGVAVWWGSDAQREIEQVDGEHTARVRMVLIASSSTFPYGMMGRLFGGGSEEGRARAAKRLSYVVVDCAYPPTLRYDMDSPPHWWGSPQESPIIPTSTSRCTAARRIRDTQCVF
jgi:hypothetical protein